MICNNCATLSSMFSKKQCLKCNLEIFNNKYVICENCSDRDRVCAICLKKMITKNKKLSGCGACKGR